MFRQLIMCSILLVVSAAFAETAINLETAIQFPVEKYQLSNGLTVLLHRDSTIPAVSVQTWYRVGSKDEKVGRTGLAHFFEHMMFKGTPTFGKDTWGKYLNSKGAEMNAFTSYDYTGYYVNAPAENLELLLRIESDRMRNLILDPKDVNSEREVVKEERRMRFDDSIEGGVREKLASLMWTKAPYNWLPIGSMQDLNQASMEDLHAFYKQFYSPNNATLVVAGAMDTEAVKKLIETYYGVLPREAIVRPEVVDEPEQKAPRRATIVREAQAPVVAIGYHLPNYKSPDHYALDLLSIVLGNGNSSRLYTHLVRGGEVATNTSSYSTGHALGGEFEIYAGLKPGANPEKGISMIDDELRKLRHDVISSKELEKARNILMKDYVDGLKRLAGRARLLASYETVYGDYTRIFSDLKMYQAVKAEDLKRVANLYLRPSQRNIVIVLPRKSGGKK